VAELYGLHVSSPVTLYKAHIVPDASYSIRQLSCVFSFDRTHSHMLLLCVLPLKGISSFHI
jgi:hypothetical protein